MSENFTEILELYDNIICIIPTGSSLFVKNHNDIDYCVIIDDENEYYKNVFVGGKDYLVRSLGTCKRIAYIDSKIRQSQYSLTFEFGKNNVLYGKFPFKNYNWFDKKEAIIEFSLARLNKQYYSPIKTINCHNPKACCKTDYWLFAMYFALLNNSIEFTDEQKNILQKCHDNELPRSYADDLCEKLQEMLPKQEEQEVEQPTISYDDLVDSKIRARYTVSQEFAILRQRDMKPDEFAEYNAYCEQCKAEAKAELGIE